MEDWQLDFEWLRVKHFIKERFNRDSLPDLQAILFLIGIQEYGRWVHDKNFTKEEKQDLIHVAVCTLLETEGYYEFKGRDQDGWPHFEVLKPFTTKGVQDQEKILIKKVVEYFKHAIVGQ